MSIIKSENVVSYLDNALLEMGLEIIPKKIDRFSIIGFNQENIFDEINLKLKGEKMSDQNKIDEVFTEIDTVVKKSGWQDYAYKLCQYLLNTEKTSDESYDLAFISVMKRYHWYFQRGISENSWMFFEYEIIRFL